MNSLTDPEKRIGWLRERGEVRSANHLCRQMLRQSGTNRELALFYLALGYYELGSLKQALRHARILHQMNPRLLSLHLNLGCIHDAMGHKGMAIREYKKELALNPDCDEAKYNLGTLFLEQRAWKKACFYLEACYSHGYLIDTVVTKLAFCLDKRKQYREEIRLYRHYLRRRPENVWCMSNLGAALMGVGRYREALRYLKSANCLSPKTGRIKRNIARVNEVLGVR